MNLGLLQGLAESGFKVSLFKMRQRLEMPRRTLYSSGSSSATKLQNQFVKPIKAMI